MRRNATLIAATRENPASARHTEDPLAETGERTMAPAVPARFPTPDQATVDGAASPLPVGQLTAGEAPHRAGWYRRIGSSVAEIDLTKVLIVGELAVAGAVIAVHAFDHVDGLHGCPRARIQMGPGGWVSMRGGAAEIRTHRAAASTGRLPVRHRRSACRETPRRTARFRSRGSGSRSHDQRLRRLRGARQPFPELQAAGGRRPWWAVLLGARPVETHWP